MPSHIHIGRAPELMLNKPELFQTIKELISAQLVVQESDDQFAFRHALTREAVYKTLLVRERRNYHRVIAEALERLYAPLIDSYLPDLAYHYYEAGIWDKTLEFAQRAGEKAQAMYAPREASAHFSRALEAAQRLRLVPASAKLYHARGLAYGIVGEFERARADYQAALDLARGAGDRQSEWQAQLDLGFLWASRDYAKTGEYLQQALTLARTLGDPATLGHTLNRVGNWYTNIERPYEALPLHREALGIFQELNDRPGMAESYDLLGLTYMLSGDGRQGGTCYVQAIAIFRELDDRQGLVSALATYSERGIAFFDGFFSALQIPRAAVMAEAEEALKLAREIDWRSGEAYALCVLGGLYASIGEIGPALKLEHAALRSAEEIEHNLWTALTLLILGCIYLMLSELDQAQQYLERAIALAHKTQSLLFVRQGTAWLASTYIMRGRARDLERAYELLRPTIGPGMEFQTFGQRLCGYAGVELALARGEPEKALQLLKALQPDAKSPALETATPRLWKLRGEVLMRLNQLDDAEAALQMALQSIPQEGVGPLAWQVHAALGQVYRLRRRREQAQAEFEIARKLIGDLAAKIPDETLQAHFRERALARVPTLTRTTAPRAAKRGFGGLTPREREVAALIAEGKSDVEIAKALDIAERTVEGHVSHISSKLGFGSRAQIAAWVVKKGLQRQ